MNGRRRIVGVALAVLIWLGIMFVGIVIVQYSLHRATIPDDTAALVRLISGAALGFTAVLAAERLTRRIRGGRP